MWWGIHGSYWITTSSCMPDIKYRLNEGHHDNHSSVEVFLFLGFAAIKEADVPLWFMHS